MKVFNTLRCLFLAGLLTVSGAAVSAQNVTVKGKVTDSRGEPVIGATVMLSSNQTVGTQTDLSGNYSISVPSSASLIYSCVGYATQTVAVAGTRNSSRRPSSSAMASSARATLRARSRP